MDQAVVDGPVTLVIRAPNQKYDDQTINCCQDWTVEKLKAHLADVYPCKPVSVSWSGFLCFFLPIVILHLSSFH
uniref:Uncharacterized protein n=1 Tax=Gouania willdenowi TaxID=441366 RepID=A0A8C5N9R4_GOUWI